MCSGVLPSYKKIHAVESFKLDLGVRQHTLSRDVTLDAR